MRTRLVCLLLLSLTACGICSDSLTEISSHSSQGEFDRCVSYDSSDKWKAAEGQLMRSLVTLKVSRLGAPYWKTTLLNVCSLLNLLGQDAWLSAEEDLVTMGRPNTPKTLEFLQSLQLLCASVQPRKGRENRDSLPKRRWPYILRRQLQSGSRRRPYILKRSAED